MPATIKERFDELLALAHHAGYLAAEYQQALTVWHNARQGAKSIPRRKKDEAKKAYMRAEQIYNGTLRRFVETKEVEQMFTTSEAFTFLTQDEGSNANG